MNVKAYVWDDEYSGESHIVWATTPGKAKALFAAEHDEEFTELRVKRLPWADEYRDMDEIPAEVFIKNGWHTLRYCEKCGLEIFGETTFLTNEGSLVCDDCAKGDKND